MCFQNFLTQDFVLCGKLFQMSQKQNLDSFQAAKKQKFLSYSEKFLAETGAVKQFEFPNYVRFGIADPLFRKKLCS